MAAVRIEDAAEVFQPGMKSLMGLIAGVVGVGVVGLAGPAAAAFPGGDGRIAFTHTLLDNSSGEGLEVRAEFVETVLASGHDRRFVPVCRRRRECRFGDPAYSPDGRRLAFADDSRRIVVSRGDGSHRRSFEPVSRRFGALVQPTWSPDGRWLAIAGDPRGRGRYSIYLLRSDLRGKLTRVPTGPFNAFDPAWSARGEIAFTRVAAPDTDDSGDYPPCEDCPPDPGALDVYAVRPDGTGLRRVTSEGGTNPSWAPSGRKLAYNVPPSFPLSGFDLGDIYVAGHTDRSRRRLTFGGTSSSPAFSPEGGRIAFASPRGIQVMNAEGRNRRLVARSRYDERLISPDWAVASIAPSGPGSQSMR